MSGEGRSTGSGLQNAAPAAKNLKYEEIVGAALCAVFVVGFGVLVVPDHGGCVVYYVLCFQVMRINQLAREQSRQRRIHLPQFGLPRVRV